MVLRSGSPTVRRPHRRYERTSPGQIARQRAVALRCLPTDRLADRKHHTRFSTDTVHNHTAICHDRTRSLQYVGTVRKGRQEIAQRTIGVSLTNPIRSGAIAFALVAIHSLWPTTGSAALNTTKQPSKSSKGPIPAPFLRARGTDTILALVDAYPDQLRASGANAIAFASGDTLPVDRQRNPTSFDDRLAHADLIDQLSIPYPRGCPVTAPAVNDDPGRLRDEAFFSAMYGSSPKQVSNHLRNVDWFGQKIPMTTVNGVNDRLAAVAEELDRLPDAKSMRKYLTPSAGSFVWRVIAGTKVHSAHSFGIAIDINTAYSDYWRWDGAAKTPAYRNRVPCEIANVFEHHGFISGAKWYHYDTMHFEYRPELLG